MVQHENYETHSENTRCLNCGESIEKDYILFINGKEYTFDSFECAVNFMAPRCSSCNSIIMGHGVHAEGEIFCNTKCAAENFSTVVP